MKIKQYLSLAALLSLLTISTACTPVTESASKAMDNANSVLKTGSEKLWAPADQVEKKPDEQKEEENKPARY